MCLILVVVNTKLLVGMQKVGGPVTRVKAMQNQKSLGITLTVLECTHWWSSRLQ